MPIASFIGGGGLGPISANLKLVSGTLDTVQPIQTTSTPQFAKLGLGASVGTDILRIQTSANRDFFFNNNGGSPRMVMSDDNGGVFATTAYIDTGTLVINSLSGGSIGFGGIPATSALLDMQGTTGALLVPRMTTVQKNALTAVNGMIVYDTTLNAMHGFVNGAWIAL